MKKIDITIPYRLKNVANIHEHHFARSTRIKLERKILSVLLMPQIRNIKLPIAIALIRVSPRRLDDFDNVRMAFKSFKDIIASLFLPDYRPGQADELACFQWTVAQKKGSPKEYAVRILISEIEEGE